MPVARRYGERQVGTSALPAARRTAGPTALSEGAGVERAKADTALTMGQVGGQVANIAERYIAEEKKRADEVAVMAAENQLALWERNRLYDPKQGALTKKGKDAFTLPEDIDAEFTTVAGEIEQTLKTPEQRAAFTRIRNNRQNAVGLNVRRHTFSEMQAYEAGEAKAGVENHLDLAMKHALDLPLARAELDKAIAIIKTSGPRAGLGPEQIESQIAAVRSTAHVGIIQNMIAAGQTKQARAYLADVEKAGQISGGTLDNIKAAVKQGTVEQEGERAAAAVWAAHAPKTDHDPISLDVMESQLREQLGDDADVLKAAISSLRSRKQGVDDGRRERMDATQQTMWGAVLKGASWQQIAQMPEAINNPTIAIKIRDYMDNEQAREESRRAARESRLASAESRAWTRQQRAEAQLEINGWARTNDLMSPEVLPTLDKGRIMAELPNIGRDNVDRVLKAHETYTKDQTSLRQLKMEDDLFKEVASASGITYVYNTGAAMTKTMKANLGRLQGAVNDAIGREAAAKGRQLTPGEQRDVMTKIVDQKVMLDDWFSDTEMTALVVNEKDRAKAYVPFDQVSQGALQDYTNYLRGEPPVSEAVRRQRIEKAYALQLMGGTRAEIESALKGGK